MKAKHGFVQGYTGYDLNHKPTDHHQLGDVLGHVTTTVHKVGITPDRPTTDPRTEPDPEPDTPQDTTTDPGPDTPPDAPDKVKQTLTEASARTDELGAVLADASYANEDTFARAETAGAHLIAPLASDEKLHLGNDPAAGQDLTDRPATHRAQTKRATQTGRTLDKIRGRTAEPVFGQLKDRQGIRQSRS